LQGLTGGSDHTNYVWADASGTPANIERLDAGKSVVWTVSSAGIVQYYDSVASTWGTAAGATATDIAVGGLVEETVYIISTEPKSTASEGHKIKKYHQLAWTDVDCPADPYRIAVDKFRDLWMISNTGKVYRYGGEGWYGFPTAIDGSRDIAIGHDSASRLGRAWVLNAYGQSVLLKKLDFDRVYMNDADQITTSGYSFANNPIKRSGSFRYPATGDSTCSSTGAKGTPTNWWQANLVQKQGQTAGFLIKEILILTSASPGLIY
jgi:hypothetical protein